MRPLPCGRGGIRTHGQLAPTLVFKTSALVHYATLPHKTLTILGEEVGFDPTRASSAQGFSKPSQWTGLCDSSRTRHYTKKPIGHLTGTSLLCMTRTCPECTMIVANSATISLLIPKVELLINVWCETS